MLAKKESGHSFGGGHILSSEYAIIVTILFT